MDQDILNKLKDLDITTKDIELLLIGLDAIKVADRSGSLLLELFASVATKENPEQMRRLEKELEHKDIHFSEVLEDLQILKGKLILLKRFLLIQEATKK
jgi:hypothetical protein